MNYVGILIVTLGVLYLLYLFLVVKKQRISSKKAHFSEFKIYLNEEIEGEYVEEISSILLNNASGKIKIIPLHPVTKQNKDLTDKILSIDYDSQLDLDFGVNFVNLEHVSEIGEKIIETFKLEKLSEENEFISEHNYVPKLANVFTLEKGFIHNDNNVTLTLSIKNNYDKPITIEEVYIEFDEITTPIETNGVFNAMDKRIWWKKLTIEPENELTLEFSIKNEDIDNIIFLSLGLVGSTRRTTSEFGIDTVVSGEKIINNNVTTFNSTEFKILSKLNYEKLIVENDLLLTDILEFEQAAPWKLEHLLSNICEKHGFKVNLVEPVEIEENSQLIAFSIHAKKSDVVIQMNCETKVELLKGTIISPTNISNSSTKIQFRFRGQNNKNMTATLAHIKEDISKHYEKLTIDIQNRSE